MTKRDILVGVMCALSALGLLVVYGPGRLGKGNGAGRYQAVVMRSPVAGDMVARLDTQSGQLVACTPRTPPDGRVEAIAFYCVTADEPKKP